MNTIPSEAPTQRPAAPVPAWGNILTELKSRPRWVLWRYTMVKGKFTKVPFQTDGTPADSTDPATWAEFDAAQFTYVTGNFDGIGFVLNGDDDLVGIDFDHCFNAETGELDPGVARFVEKLSSYSEISPSGTGLRVFALGKLPPDGRKRGKIEMYDRARYLTVTGNHFPGTPQTINRRNDAIAAIHAEVFAERLARHRIANGPTSSALNLDDAALLQRAHQARNGARFTELYDRGDWRGAGFASQSEADLCLCSMLAFWTGRDPLRIDALFRTSALMREKWDRADYREHTLAEAVAGCAEVYTNGGDGRMLADSATPKTYERQEPEWPDPIKEAAFHGLAGDFVRKIMPHTEADPVGILVHFLVMAGNVIGRSVYRTVEGAEHTANLFAVLVGDTSGGRKGSAGAQALRPFRLAAPDWVRDQIVSGLASGEGLKWAVRDPIERREPIKERGRHTGEYQVIEVDPGVRDKRLLVIESEFASVLRVSTRDGNTLSTTIREAWDSGNLRSTTKNSPARATGAHISIVGHITSDELLRYLDSTEAANGFANRFLWIGVRRSKLLPFGGDLHDEDFDNVATRLRDVIAWASDRHELEFDHNAREAWARVYEPLSTGHPGLLGAILKRAEAQVLRLSILYAALDCSSVITRAHLAAALALWDYAQASARFIFGERLGDPEADFILISLRTNPEGLTRTQIRDLLNRHGDVDGALDRLRRAGLAKPEKIATGGRSAELWRPTNQ